MQCAVQIHDFMINSDHLIVTLSTTGFAQEQAKAVFLMDVILHWSRHAFKPSINASTTLSDKAEDTVFMLLALIAG